VATDAAGNVYVAEESRIDKFTSNGAYLTSWGGGLPGSGPGQFRVAYFVAVDAAGNIYASDPGNSRIEKFGFLPTPTKPMSWGGLKRLYR
jgi:hypothetical protein